MPFITEEIWQALPHSGESLMVASYPSANRAPITETIEQEMETVQKVVSGIRDIKGTQGIAPSKPVNVTVSTPNSTVMRSLRAHEKLIGSLVRINTLTIGDALEQPAQAASTTAMLPGGALIEIRVDLAGVLDVPKEKARIEKRLKEISVQVSQTEQKLANPEFVAKVPSEVLEKTRAKHQEFLAEQQKLSAELRRLDQLRDVP
jgi:valyl-tRNA synthetase